MYFHFNTETSCHHHLTLQEKKEVLVLSMRETQSLTASHYDDHLDAVECYVLNLICIVSTCITDEGDVYNIS